MTMKIGVYVCECGTNIADNVDIDRVLAEVSPLDGVEVVERHKLLCSEAGKDFIKEGIREHGLTHVVVAACSPKQHEATFMTVCEQEGLNPYLFQMSNIREQCAWVTPDKEEATDKTIRAIKAAIGRVRYHAPLTGREVECSPDVLVIGGGIAGIKASQLLASPHRKVYLVEKAASLGGKVTGYAGLFPDTASPPIAISQEIEKLEAMEGIQVLTESEVGSILGFLGNFKVQVRGKAEGAEMELEVGAIVLATGFDVLDPSNLSRYSYGKIDNVLTGLEFERMNAAGEIALKDGKPPASVAIIHCVGRDEKGYCSRVCCLYSLKFARYLKDKLPAVRVSQLYSDLCIPGQTCQKYYEETKEAGVEFVRADRTEVGQASGKGITVKYESDAGAKGSLDVDMVILATAIEPGSDTAAFAEMLNIPLSEEGFFAEEHEKLAPVSTTTEGIFIVGCAQGPQSVTDSIVQSEAAAGRILSSLVPGKKLDLEVKTSEISETFCTGCQTCISVCPYGAISLNEEKLVSVVNEVLCHGCGNCVAACPSGAISLKHFTFTQLYQEMEEALR